MKINKTQTGFTPVHLLLLLVIFGIIGFAGWKVYDVSKTVSQPETATAPAPVAQKAEPKVPDGFTEYENKELGFKFAYPKEWGSVVVKESKFAEDDPGQRWQLSFSMESDAFLGLTSKDWTTAHGRGGSCHATGGFQQISRPTAQDNEHTVQKILIDREYLVAGTTASYGYCQGAIMFSEYYFKNTAKYLGVLFTFTVVDENVEQTFLEEYKKDEEKVFPAAEKEILLKIANSFKEI